MENIYWIIGYYDDYYNKVKIYNGGSNSDPKFVKLGCGLGKAYRSKKIALNRIEILKPYLPSRQFHIYKVTTNIKEDTLEE